MHGRKKNEKGCQHLEKLQPQILALHSKLDLLLACDYKPDKPIFELPIKEGMKLRSRNLETWVRLVTSTVKQADAAQCLGDTNHTITTFFLAPALPDPAY